MKRFLFSFCLLLTTAGVWAQTGGYQISIQVKPLKKTWVYMGYYYGKILPVSDSAFLDETGHGVFKGTKALPQGIYVIAPSKSRILTELLIGKNQKFSLVTDTTNPEKLTVFTGSPENTQFQAYTAYISNRGMAIEQARQAQAKASGAEKDKLQAVIQKNTDEIETYRKTVIKQQPTSLLAAIFGAMQEPDLGGKYKNAHSMKDSLTAYYNARQHYWDGVNFMDGRIVRTPVFEKKLKTYFDAYISPEPDSITHETNWMLALGRNDSEMFKYLINYFVDSYFNPRIMGQDKVFLNMFEKYFSKESPVTWLSEAQLKQISDRAYMLMANQLGTQAGEMNLLDTNGAVKSLYGVSAPYTVVAFYDPNCGHCKIEIPKMDSLYKVEWKKEQVQVYAVMVAENSMTDWKPFIRQYGNGWVHVHQTVEMKAEEEKNKQPNFHQLYDVRSTPTLFLLDKDKRIIAKNLALDDLEKVLQQKIKQGETAVK